MRSNFAAPAPRVARVAVLCFLLSACLGAWSQVPAPSTPPPDAASGGKTTKIVDYTLPPDKLQEAHALYLTVVKFQVIEALYGFAILLALLYFGVVARFRALAESLSQRKWAQGLLVLPLFLVTVAVLSIPAEVYHQHVRRAYGLSIQGWGSWWGDWVKILLLTVSLETVLLLLLYAMIRRSPRRWWFYGWLLGVPVVVFVIFISPLVIEPMFFKFTPLNQTNPTLAAEIERVVKRGGMNIPTSRMYSMNASEKYTGDNAYVSGFGASQHVVVWDTTQKHLTDQQIMFVFGHEMGHYVLHHIVKGILATLVGLLALLYLAYRCSGWMLGRWGAHWKIRDIADLASVPVLVFLLSFFSFVSSPIQNGFSRYLEHQADTYGLEVTHGLVPDSKMAAAQAFQKLGENWLDYPYTSDLYEWWAFDHPATAKRMRYAQEYDPWGEGKQPEFVKNPGVP